MKVKLGDPVMAHGKKGRVTATSGTDNECIVAFEDNTSTGWMSAKLVKLLPQEEKE